VSTVGEGEVVKLDPLSRQDTPVGLSFSLGYSIEPGSSLVFLRSSYARADRARGDFQEQWRDTLSFVKHSVESVSSDARIVKIRRFLTTGRDERIMKAPQFRNPRTREVWQEVFGDALPASTSLQVPATGLMGSLIDLEVWAAAPSQSVAAEVVRFAGDTVLPVAVAVRGDQRMCVAAVRSEPGGSVEAQLLSCLTQITQRFAENRAGPHDVLKLTVYYRDARWWPTIEGIVAGMFGEHSPVLNGVMVSNLRTPDGEIEITGWARCSASTPDASSGHDGSVAMVDLSNRLLALTGTGALPIFVGGEADQMYKAGRAVSIEEQAHLAMANQRAVLESAGASFADVFRSNWYVTDMRDWEAIEPIVADYFPSGLPVPMVVEVSRLTAKQGVRLEPDLWASLPAER
jgi:enamine deaminase RidA (YjgF/YER057c/UK114 family)